MPHTLHHVACMSNPFTSVMLSSFTSVCVCVCVCVCVWMDGWVGMAIFLVCFNFASVLFT